MAAMPTSVGNLPQYRLRGDFEPVLRLESPNEVGFDRFGEVANWRLMALETGSVSVKILVGYEKTVAGEDGAAVRQDANDQSEPIKIRIRPR